MADLSEIVGVISANPQLAVVMIIQFILGLALGYIAVKAFKYIVAFVAILALGSLLSVWSIGMTPEDVLKTIGLTVVAVKNLVVLLGLTTAGPVTAGFIIGAITALIKK